MVMKNNNMYETYNHNSNETPTSSSHLNNTVHLLNYKTLPAVTQKYFMIKLYTPIQMLTQTDSWLSR